MFCPYFFPTSASLRDLSAPRFPFAPRDPPKGSALHGRLHVASDGSGGFRQPAAERRLWCHEGLGDVTRSQNEDFLPSNMEVFVGIGIL